MAEKGGTGMEATQNRKIWGLSQEGLKSIACLTMFLDHIGAVFVPGYYTYYVLRLIGRIAFPIYCFLLAEGVHYTRNPRKYALRLALGAVASEIPFDLAFYGGVTLAHQSVMLTLLLGFGVVMLWEKLPIWAGVTLTAMLALAAEWLNTDYGGWGVVLIVAFGALREKPRWQLVLLLTLILLSMDSIGVPFLWGIPIELFALLALIPIGLYSGKRGRPARGKQLFFYGFYPVHLLLLWLLAQAV